MTLQELLDDLNNIYNDGIYDPIPAHEIADGILADTLTLLLIMLRDDCVTPDDRTILEEIIVIYNSMDKWYE